MALIKCSECGNEISDKATSCPHCGCPCTSNHIENNEVTPKKNIMQNTFVQVLIAIPIGIIILIMMIFANSTPSSTGVAITSNGTKAINDNDFEIIYEETHGKRNDDGTYIIEGKLKQNIEESYTSIMPTFNLLDENGNKVRETSGWLSANYEGNNIWSFIVQGNDADGIVKDFELNYCYGY